jgi:hypothetical protein
MRACAIAAIAIWTASSVAVSAADVLGGPDAGYGPYAYSPRMEPLIIYDYEPGVIVRSYWWSPWQNRHYFPKTGKRPKVGRLERVTARKSSPPQDFYRSWSVSSVFAPALSPPPSFQRYMPYGQPYLQPYGQPYEMDSAPSLAQPK